MYYESLVHFFYEELVSNNYVGGFEVRMMLFNKSTVACRVSITLLKEGAFKTQKAFQTRLFTSIKEVMLPAQSVSRVAY